MTRPTHAFTLIEVLVVLAIIGILAGLMIPNYLSARKKPYDGAALACGQAIVRTQTSAALNSARTRPPSPTSARTPPAPARIRA